MYGMVKMKKCCDTACFLKKYTCHAYAAWVGWGLLRAARVLGLLRASALGGWGGVRGG